MNVEVERGADVGVSEYGADRLVVAAALYAACCEGVAQAVEFHRRQAELPHQVLVVPAVDARLDGLLVVGQHVAAGAGQAEHGAQDARQFGVDGYFALRADRLRPAYYHLRALLSAFADVYPLYGAVDPDDAHGHVDVFPLQRANLSYAHSRAQADVQAEPAEREVAAKVVHECALFGVRKHRQFRLPVFFRHVYVPVSPLRQALLVAVSQHHLQHEQYVLDGAR